MFVLPPPSPSRAPDAAGAVAQHGFLPKVITSGVDTAPTGALALAEAAPQKYDDSALLARAAALTAPLPPMPVANAGAPGATQTASAPAQTHAGVAYSATLAAQKLARMFGGLPFGVFKAATPASANPGDLRGPQQ